MEIPDRIEREITIDAPIDRVWALLVVPGWWIGDRAERSRRRKGGAEFLRGPRRERFPVRLVSAKPKRYLSYRWVGEFPGETPGRGTSTLVEFWLSERDGKTRLRVVESGLRFPASGEKIRGGPPKGDARDGGCAIETGSAA